MPNSSSPIRLAADLVRSAELVAPLMSRSIAQQVAHWAAIGRELEAGGEISIARIAGVLRGRRRYDRLSAEEQAWVRAEWSRRMEVLRRALRLDRVFADQGHRYAELDASGRVAERSPARRRGRRKRG